MLPCTRNLYACATLYHCNLMCVDFVDHVSSQHLQDVQTPAKSYVYMQTACSVYSRGLNRFRTGLERVYTKGCM